MFKELYEIQTLLFVKINLKIDDYYEEEESEKYHACHFKLNNNKTIFRKAKITPTKNDQFITFRKRRGNGPIEPFHKDLDDIDYFIILVENNEKKGLFVFPKEVLIQQGIISTYEKEGKRAFRVYPIWDETTSRQSVKSQKWQLNYFIEISEEIEKTQVLKKLMQKNKLRNPF
jgi:hypothetical protein